MSNAGWKSSDMRPGNGPLDVPHFRVGVTENLIRMVQRTDNKDGLTRVA